MNHHLDGSPGSIRVQRHEGARSSLRALFELAEDSPTALNAYINDGDVLVAVLDREVFGHLQLTSTADPEAFEVKNMAVTESARGKGIGSALIAAALELSRQTGASRIVVATAAADIDNLRFYQRRGFRLFDVERDAFTEDSGYPPGLLIDGIELRDRVWLDQQL